MSNTELNALVTQVRRDILRMVHKVNSGHPGGSLGCTEFLVALYSKVMNHKTEFDMNGINEDLFFLSNGHISPVIYSVLARSGYFPVVELNTFRLLDSRLQGHPTTHEGLPGIRIASGSLGQGMSVAIGAALSKKLNELTAKNCEFTRAKCAITSPVSSRKKTSQGSPSSVSPWSTAIERPDRPRISETL